MRHRERKVNHVREKRWEKNRKKNFCFEVEQGKIEGFGVEIGVGRVIFFSK